MIVVVMGVSGSGQFAALEPPQHAIEIDVRESVEDCIDSIAARLVP